MRAWFLICLGLVAAPGVAAQAPDFLVSSGREMTRADLQASLQQLEAAAVSEDYGEGVRAQAAARAAQIRQRLTEGDFRVGDRIQVQVQDENWDSNSPGAIATSVTIVPTPGSIAVPTGRGSTGATFAVQEGPSVKFPDIPAISLRGVLRSELQEHLTEELSRYIINPVVEAETLLRISVLGSVRGAGFYYPAATQNIGDVIMMAGGPGSDANYDEITLLRGGQTLWGPEEVQSLIAEGRTLDQINMQAGDIIEVPRESDSNIWLEVGRYALIAGSTLLLGIRVF